MIISPSSIYHFILGLPSDVSNKILRDLKQNLDSLEFSALYLENPKNNFIKIAHPNAIYLFKQPKLSIPEQSWMINVEAEFYKAFKHKSFVIDSFFYHGTSKTLAFPLLKDLGFNSENLAIQLKEYHQEMILKKRSNKIFSKKNILNNGTPYQRFVDILKSTFNSRQLLNDTLYKIKLSREDLEKQEIIVDFLFEKKTKEFFINFIDQTKKIRTHIIHGDIRIENIIFLENKTQKIIDFELVCEGDPLWDLAKLIESIFSHKTFREFNIRVFEKKFNYLVAFLKAYWDVQDLSSKRQEIQCFINYWALVKTGNLFYSSYDFLIKDITVIKRFIDEGNILCNEIITEKLTDNCFYFAKGCKYL